MSSRSSSNEYWNAYEQQPIQQDLRYTGGNVGTPSYDGRAFGRARGPDYMLDPMMSRESMEGPPRCSDLSAHPPGYSRSSDSSLLPPARPVEEWRVATGARYGESQAQYHEGYGLGHINQHVARPSYTLLAQPRSLTSPPRRGDEYDTRVGPPSPGRTRELMYRFGFMGSSQPMRTVLGGTGTYHSTGRDPIGRRTRRGTEAVSFRIWRRRSIDEPWSRTAGGDGRMDDDHYSDDEVAGPSY